MSLVDPTSDTTPFFSDDNEGEGSSDKDEGPSPQHEDESGSGLSSIRAYLTVAVLFYINLLNYMDRFTVAGN